MIDDPAMWGIAKPASEFFEDLSDPEIAEWREELRRKGPYINGLEWKALRLMPKRLRIYDATGIDSSGMDAKQRRRYEYHVAKGHPVPQNPELEAELGYAAALRAEARGETSTKRDRAMAAWSRGR